MDNKWTWLLNVSIWEKITGCKMWEILNFKTDLEVTKFHHWVIQSCRMTIRTTLEQFITDFFVLLRGFIVALTMIKLSSNVSYLPLRSKCWNTHDADKTWGAGIYSCTANVSAVLQMADLKSRLFARFLIATIK